MPDFNRVCQSLRKGFERSQGAIRVDTSSHEKEQLKAIARILESVVPQTDYLLGDENQRYEDSHFKLLFKMYIGQIFPAFASGVNCLLTRT